MKYCIIIILYSFLHPFTAQESLEAISQDLLLSVRYHVPYEPFARQLNEISIDELIISLSNENQKKAFWLNIYNAFIKIKAIENLKLYEHHRNDFFKKKWITIAQIPFSFDAIEHGILRHSQWKLGKGYINSWFPGKLEKHLRVKEVDYRIHFALNCGAKSCPPVACYDSKQLDTQLKEASNGFLLANSTYDSTKNVVKVSKILSWFSGDFGGKKGIRSMLMQLEIIPKNSKPKLEFDEYDWTFTD